LNARNNLKTWFDGLDTLTAGQEKRRGDNVRASADDQQGRGSQHYFCCRLSAPHPDGGRTKGGVFQLQGWRRRTEARGTGSTGGGSSVAADCYRGEDCR